MMRAQRPALAIPPASFPVTLAEVKQRLSIDYDDSDSDLSALIAAAVDLVDGRRGILGVCLLTQTWTWKTSAFPACNRLALPVWPVQSVVINVIDSDGASTEFTSPGNWDLVADRSGDVVELRSGIAWPSTVTRADAVTLSIVAGYGNAGSDVPASLRHAILTMIADFHAARESFARSGTGRAPAMVDFATALNIHKRNWISSL